MTARTFGTRRTVARSGYAAGAVGCVIVLALGAAAGWTSAQTTSSILVAGSVLAALAAAASTGFAGVFRVAFVALVAIPVYAIPGAVRYPAALVFTGLAAFVILRSLSRSEFPHLELTDKLVVGMFAVMTVAVLTGARTPADYEDALMYWAAPYAAARMIVGRELSPASYTRTVVWTALALLPAVVLEAANGNVLFQRLAAPQDMSSVWLTPDVTRFGAFRVAASFGHPLALSVFLASACALAAALAFDRRRAGGPAAVWVAAALALGLGQALTVSRTGWILIAVSLLWLVVTSKARLTARLLALAGIGASVATVAYLVPTALSVVSAISSSVGPTGANITYRESLLQFVFTHPVLSAWGTRSSELPAQFGSVDNAYIYFAQQWGLVAVSALLLIPLSIARAAAKSRENALACGIGGTAVAAAVAVFFVAFITQEQIAVWCLFGAAAAACSPSRRETAPSAH